jgi:hypothetical protein
LNKISTATLVCPRFIESVSTSHVNDVIILLTSSVLQKVYKLNCNIIWVPRLVFKISNGFDEGIIYLCTNIYISLIVS